MTEVTAGAAVIATFDDPNLVVSWIEVAIIVAVPDPEGVNTPALLTDPIPVGLTDHVTAVLKVPVPVTVGVQADVCVVNIDAGRQLTATDVIVGGTFIVTTELPDFVESCVEVAVIVAVPAPAGVKTPALLTAPIPDGLTDQDTAVLKLPVPVTVEVQVDVCVVRIDVGEQTTEAEVIVGGTTTVTDAEPDLVVSWTDVAVTEAVPDAEAVNRPAVVTVPPVADHVTAEL